MLLRKNNIVYFDLIAQKHAFDYLEAPFTRVNSQDSSLGYAPTFVDEFLPSVERTVKACKAVMYKL